jgi:xylan 1,4-beta-xylosidase
LFGELRLHSLPAANFYLARNSLCQRQPAPESIVTLELDTSGMAVGDRAGHRHGARRQPRAEERR